VTYTRLPPGEFARLQPVQAGLLTAGEGEGGGGTSSSSSWEVRAALEEAVKGRCALTVGDVLRVPAPVTDPAAPVPAFFTVLVRELRPPSRTGGVSIVEVDLAVDLDPSVEGEAAVEAAAASAEAARASAAAAAAVAAERLAASLKAAAVEEAVVPAAPLPPPDLPPEPDASDPLSLSIRLRLPGGALAARRWSPADPASALAAWGAWCAGSGAVRLALPPLPGAGGGRLALPADATPLGSVPGLGPGAAVVLVAERDV
jgi:hypothetical protein